jgi:hypothetical protein
MWFVFWSVGVVVALFTFFRLGSFDSVDFNSRSMLLLLSCFLASSINQDRFGVSPLLCFLSFLLSFSEIW